MSSSNGDEVPLKTSVYVTGYGKHLPYTGTGIIVGTDDEKSIPNDNSVRGSHFQSRIGLPPNSIYRSYDPRTAYDQSIYNNLNLNNPSFDQTQDILHTLQSNQVKHRLSQSGTKLRPEIFQDFAQPGFIQSTERPRNILNTLNPSTTTTLHPTSPGLTTRQSLLLLPFSTNPTGTTSKSPLDNEETFHQSPSSLNMEVIKQNNERSRNPIMLPIFPALFQPESDRNVYILDPNNENNEVQFPMEGQLPENSVLVQNNIDSPIFLQFDAPLSREALDNLQPFIGNNEFLSDNSQVIIDNILPGSQLAKDALPSNIHSTLAYTTKPDSFQQNVFFDSSHHLLGSTAEPSNIFETKVPSSFVPHTFSSSDLNNGPISSTDAPFPQSNSQSSFINNNQDTNPPHSNNPISLTPAIPLSIFTLPPLSDEQQQNGFQDNSNTHNNQINNFSVSPQIDDDRKYKPLTITSSDNIKPATFKPRPTQGGSSSLPNHFTSYAQENPSSQIPNINGGYGQPSQGTNVPNTNYDQPNQDDSIFPTNINTNYGQPSQQGPFVQNSSPGTSYNQPNTISSSIPSSRPTTSYNQPSLVSSSIPSSRPTTSYNQPNLVSSSIPSSRPTTSYNQPTQVSSNAPSSRPSTTYGQPNQVSSSIPTTGYGQPNKVSSTNPTSRPSITYGQPSIQNTKPTSRPSTGYSQPNHQSTIRPPSPLYGLPPQQTTSNSKPPRPTTSYNRPSTPSFPRPKPTYGTTSFSSTRRPIKPPTTFSRPYPTGVNFQNINLSPGLITSKRPIRPPNIIPQISYQSTSKPPTSYDYPSTTTSQDLDLSEYPWNAQNKSPSRQPSNSYSNINQV